MMERVNKILRHPVFAEHLARLEEARRRDHNKLGRELEYFTTVDVIGHGWKTWNRPGFSAATACPTCWTLPG